MELDPEGKVVNELRDPLGHHEYVYTHSYHNLISSLIFL